MEEVRMDGAEDGASVADGAPPAADAAEATPVAAPSTAAAEPDPEQGSHQDAPPQAPNGAAPAADAAPEQAGADKRGGEASTSHAEADYGDDDEAYSVHLGQPSYTRIDVQPSETASAHKLVLTRRLPVHGVNVA
jgi:hypothetical protein